MDSHYNAINPQLVESTNLWIAEAKLWMVVDTKKSSTKQLWTGYLWTMAPILLSPS